MKSIINLIWLFLVSSVIPTFVCSGGSKTKYSALAESKQLEQQGSLIDLETLLRHASQIIQPLQTSSPVEQQLQIPSEEMSPPADDSYNYYMPLYHENVNIDQVIKLDEHSRKLEAFTPPPPPSPGSTLTQQTVASNYNYYSVKPRKFSKKFNAAIKNINYKWLKDDNQSKQSARHMLSPLIDMTKAIFLRNNDQMDYDNSFYAMDVNIQQPDNNMPNANLEQQMEANNDDEPISRINNEDDLMAVPAIQVTLLRPKLIY